MWKPKKAIAPIKRKGVEAKTAKGETKRPTILLEPVWLTKINGKFVEERHGTTTHYQEGKGYLGGLGTKASRDPPDKTKNLLGDFPFPFLWYFSYQIWCYFIFLIACFVVSSHFDVFGQPFCYPPASLIVEGFGPSSAP